MDASPSHDPARPDGSVCPNGPEAGSLIIDILIGMAIFALLAIITISSVNSWRQRAYEMTVLADAQKISYIAASLIGTSTPIDENMVAAASSRLSAGVEVAEFAKDDAGRLTFCLEYVIDGGDPQAYARYDSSNGGIHDHGRGEGC